MAMGHQETVKVSTRRPVTAGLAAPRGAAILPFFSALSRRPCAPIFLPAAVSAMLAG
jgi:hypothetical protein